MSTENSVSRYQLWERFETQVSDFVRLLEESNDDALLRWFACDCATHTLLREKTAQLDLSLCFDCIDVVRGCILGEESLQSMIDCQIKVKHFAKEYDEAELADLSENEVIRANELFQQLSRGEVSAESALQSEALMRSATKSIQRAMDVVFWVCSYGALDAAAGALRNTITAAISLDKECSQTNLGNSEFQSQEVQIKELSWLRARWMYLSEVWHQCGSESARLLFEGKCPIQEPDDAKL